MKSSKSKRYAIVDLETTGGRAVRDKITEVGIVIMEDLNIIDSYTSLVNPGRSIPWNITRITGINDEMVEDAPYFHEIARDIVEKTEGCIFVAHNVNFDYGFLRAEFNSLGYTYTRKCLDTVKLSRKTFPHLRSHSLGNLIKHFEIPVSARHRALEDAQATAVLLKLIIEQQDEDTIDAWLNRGIKSTKLPDRIDIERLHELPDVAGVYYMYNQHNQIIYIGKSINIKKRVFQHFAAETKKAHKMKRNVCDISTVHTGSELIALILESYEIKKHQPELNRAQRTTAYNYFIYHYIDEQGYQRYDYAKSNKKSREGKEILAFYGSKPAALADLNHATESYDLCQSKMGIHTGDGPCYRYHLKKCNGACIKSETAESYNERATQVSQALNKIFQDNLVIILEGRQHDERGVVLIEGGHFIGYGYIDTELNIHDIEELKESITYRPINPEVDQIIKTYISAHPNMEYITY